MGGLLSVTGMGTAAAADQVTTYDELSTAFAAGGTVTLGGDITGSGDALAVGAGDSVTLDLAGYSLSMSGVPAGKAAIGVPPSAELTIEDSIGDGELIVTGGSGGAGIGGGAGPDGESAYNQTSKGIEGMAGAAGTVIGGNGLPGGDGGTIHQGGGDGGAGGAVAGRAPVVTGGDGAQGGAGAESAGGGQGGAGGAALSSGGGLALGGPGGDGGRGGVGGPGGVGGNGGASVGAAGSVGGEGGDGGVGGAGANGGSGGGTGVVTILGGFIIATGGDGAAGIGGGVGGSGDLAGNGGNGGYGGAASGAGAGVGGLGGSGGDGGTGGAGGDGGDGGTVTIVAAEVTAAGGTGAADIGGGAGGTGGPGGSGGYPGADGASSRGQQGTSGPTGALGDTGLSGTLLTGPGAPTSVTASAKTESAVVSFTAPATGSSDITGYEVTATDSSDVGNGGQQADGTASPITVGGLTAGDAYTFTVRATNDVGTGLASAPSDGVTVKYGFATGTNATISGTPKVGEVLTADAGDVSPVPDALRYRWFADAVAIPRARSTTFTPTGAQQGKAITVRVRAVKDGYSTSTDTSAATEPVARPATELVVTAPVGPQLVGRRIRVTTSGLKVGEDYTIRIGGNPVATGIATSNGVLRTRVTVPDRAADGRAAFTVTGSERDRTGRTTARIFTAKTLGSDVKKERVSVGHRQRVTFTGLAHRERVTVRYRGERISPVAAHATLRGVYTLAFTVGDQRGVKTVRATGRYRVRTATETFRVTR